MKKPGEEAIKLFLKHPDKPAFWVIRRLDISPNTLYRNPGYPSAVAARAAILAKKKGVKND